MKKKKRWEKFSIPLDKNHSWDPTPGYQIIVIPHGGVWVEVPMGWRVKPDKKGGLEIRDRKFPDDHCLIQITVIAAPSFMNMDRMPLVPLFKDAMEHNKEERKDKLLSTGPINELHRPGLNLVWCRREYIEHTEQKHLASRTALARNGTIQVLITQTNYFDEYDQWTYVWENLLKTLRVSETVDLATGRRIRPREN